MAALTTYTPSENAIVHTTQVDFVDRDTFGTPVHLVQGDDKLPVIEVELYKGGQPYAVPSTASGNIRWKKPAPSPYFVMDPLLGVSTDRTKAYIQVTQKMTTQHGQVDAVLELIVSDGTGMSGPLSVYLDRNPVSEDDIEDSSEFKSLESYVSDAQTAASQAKSSQTAAAASATQAKNSQTAAATSAANAKKSEDEALKSAQTALHPPILQGDTDHWWVWDRDTGAYKQTDIDAGVSLTIAETVTGAPGDPAKVENVGTATDPKLKFTIPLGNQGPVSSVNGGTGDVVIGGRNLIVGSQHPVLAPYQGSVINYQYDVSVNDWGAKDAVRVHGQSGSSILVGVYYVGNYIYGNQYCFSIYVKNNSETKDILASVSLQDAVNEPVHPGEAKHLSFYGTTIDSGPMQFLFRVQNVSDDFDFIIWHPKLERGTVPTDWTPAPEDYLGSFNAYNITNMHRNIFRGKSLGSAFTAAQKAAIAAGTWDDLYLGDYWTINNHTWRIADFDYWLGKGDTSCTKHHIVVVPDASLYLAQMHNTESGGYEAGATANTTEGGYFNSDMRTTNLARAKTLIETDFGTGSILNHRILLTNVVKDGYPSAGTWYDSEVDLMNEMMVYGAYHFAPRGNGAITPYNHTTECTQLALFQVVPYYIMPNRSWYWLRDVVSATAFALVSYTGYSNYGRASYARGVRPAVGIVGS